MKFLRLAFYVLIAQLVLSGCAGEAVEETSSSSSSEINFDAYVGRNASTRSGVTDITFLKDTLFNAGFGVFARYNYNGKILSLLDTEHVTWNKDQNHWEYTNTRFWPSEGSVDFYAFAPYNGDVKMGKLPDYLVNNPDSKDETYIYFPSNVSPVDLVWANAEKQTKDSISSINGKVKFQFKHALARLGLDIKANQDLEKNGAVITVEEVDLYGPEDYKGVFDMVGYLNLKTGGWHVVKEESTRWYYAWTPTGKVGKEDGNDGKEDGEKKCQKLSASQLNDTTNIITNDCNSYIFIIPQTKDEKFHLKITYTVKQGDFVEKVTAKKNLLEVLDPSETSNKSFTFERGKAYVFHLILSLDDPIDFKVTPTVNEWGKG
nr:fimbrillin family protein [uncultured Prevotella sp.]